jgi:hypothetical protein
MGLTIRTGMMPKRSDAEYAKNYLNEEEIQGYGTKVTLTNQQTRWLNGATFTWRGFAKKISGYQANSGLMFDELRQIQKQSAREDKEQRAEELKQAKE